MGSMSKGFALLFILTMSVSCLILLIIRPSYAQSIPTPSVPEFSLKYFTKSLDSEPETSINPYTGQNETISSGYHYDTRNVEITIKNQPFNPFTDSNGNHVDLNYNVTFKGHYTDTWSHYPDSTYEDLFSMSATGDTIINVSLEGWPELPKGALLDFRLQAVIGHYNYDTPPSGTDYITGFTAYQTSNWSNPLTVTVGETSSTTSTSQTATLTSTSTPTVPEFPIWIPMFFTATVIFGCLFVYFRKHNPVTNRNLEWENNKRVMGNNKKKANDTKRCWKPE